MIRTFIAIDLPEKFIPEIEKIESMINVPGIKLVEPKMVHITMKFLGDIKESNVGPIVSALSRINSTQFDATLKSVGVFPKLAYVKVVWMGAEGNFDALHNEIERVLAPFNFEKDHKFSPHATIARVKQLKDRAGFLEKLRKLENIRLGTMKVESISFKKSTLRPEGPIYETLKEIKLNRNV